MTASDYKSEWVAAPCVSDVKVAERAWLNLSSMEVM